MHLIIVGLNHKTADVDIRERFYFPVEKLETAYQQLSACSSIHGSVILSTCNRVEVYASVENVKKGFDEIIQFLSSFHRMDESTLRPFLYQKNCQLAVTHLFKVISGIDSMVVGEYQIQGQVRDAYNEAKRLNATDSYLNKVFQSAINTGKRIRTETEIGKGTTSVATLATELIKKVFNQKNTFNVLLVGAGKMGGLTAANLTELNSCKITIANRSESKAEELATQFNGITIPFNQRFEAMLQNEVIIVSTSADHFTVGYPEVNNIMQQHPNRTKLFIDLSIPRNIDPQINQIENCIVYSIDDINNMIDLNLSKRQHAIEHAEKIISEVSEDYYDWYYTQIILPIMHEIKGKLDILTTSTLAQYKPMMGTMSDDQQQFIQEMMHAYADKLIKVIMRNLKNITSKEEMIKLVETLKNTLTVDTVIQDEMQRMSK
ncbi:MAG: glutamyl-tRNA reductase [Microbacter sp.]